MASNQTKKQSAKKSTTKKNTTNTRTGKTTPKKTTTKARQAQKPVEKKSGFWDEGLLLCVFVAAVFLSFSNFKLCGSFGNVIAGFFFGLFGFMQYILPIYVLIMTALLVVNKYNSIVIKKVSLSLVIVLLLCTLSQMVTDIEASGALELYRYSYKNRTGGGIIGGSFCALFYKYLSGFGAWVLVMVLLFVFILLFLNKSIVDVYQAIHNIYEVTDDDVEEYETIQQERKIQRQNQQQERLEKKNQRQNMGKKNPSVSILDSIVIFPENPNENPAIAPIDGSNSLNDITAVEEKNISKKRKPKKVREDMHEVHVAGAANTLGNIAEASQHAEQVVPAVLPKEEQQDFSQLSITGMVETTAHMVPEEEAKLEAAASVAGKKRKVRHTKESRQETEKEVENTAAMVEKTNVMTSIMDNYQCPPVSLLKKGKAVSKNNQNEMRDTAMKLQQTLATFGVNVTITNVSCGPAVTRYEMQPELGVKVSRIVSLADDIKLNLAAADIRIEAPIPGKAAVGIEVPNKENTMVAFRDLIEDPAFINSKADLPFAVGKDIGGNVVVHDIAKMPHLLVAGATGSGKSVCINTLIMSLIYKKHPDEVKLIMVDPKVVELNVYNGIPHLLIPVVTDPKKAAGALNWAVVEMMDRYEKFKNVDVRNLDGYNVKVDQLISSGQVTADELPRMPKIVIIVDELADLMMVAKGEVEDAIVRLSQLARAAGIHLVIATQRPSVDVITGLIKANVPSRAAFAVSSNVDSRTILDGAGAEKLLGKGDMLFYPTGLPKPIRVQGAFVSDSEVNQVVEFLKEQSGPVEYDTNITEGIDSSKFAGAASPGGTGIGTNSDTDEYFTDAGRFIIEKNKASIGMLQRVYKIGFNRAARIMDQLCDAGVVGPEEGTKPRTILMSMEEFENYLEEN